MGFFLIYFFNLFWFSLCIDFVCLCGSDLWHQIDSIHQNQPHYLVQFVNHQLQHSMTPHWTMLDAVPNALLQKIHSLMFEVLVYQKVRSVMRSVNSTMKYISSRSLFSFGLSSFFDNYFRFSLKQQSTKFVSTKSKLLILPMI